MDEFARRRLIAGIILIALGAGFLLMQITRGFGEAVILLVIGGLLIAAYFYRRLYGFLVPGCILVGIGLGNVGEVTLSSIRTFSESGFTQIGLGIGFIGIYVIDLIYRGSTHLWSLGPGGVLLVSGVASLAGTGFRTIFTVGWPLILVLVGLLLLAGAFGLIGKKKGQ